MRLAPPFEIRVEHFGVWRAAVAGLAAVACLAMAAWWLQHPTPVPVSVSLACALGIVVAIAGGIPSWRQAPRALRRVAGQWQRQRGTGPWEAGELAIALDLGAFVLLRFVPDAADGLGEWIPVQRKGLERQWHELRCAIHAPRPGARTPAPGANPASHG